MGKSNSMRKRAVRAEKPMRCKGFMRYLQWAVAALVLIIVLYPIYQLLILSLRPLVDIRHYIYQVQSRGVRFIPVYLIPRAFSFEQYLLTVDDVFLRAYGVAVLYTMAVTAIHFPIAFVLGFSFAKLRFLGKDVLFFLFIASMVLPFHVTVVPLNQVLHRLGLFDTPWAVILPGAFAPLGVFLFRQFISQVPDETLEAAAIDGAGLLRTLVFIVLPMIRYGLSVFLLLTITLQWGAIEPVLAFVRQEEWRPVSLLLRDMMARNPSGIFAPGVLYMLPMLLVYGAVRTAQKKIKDETTSL